MSEQIKDFGAYPPGHFYSPIPSIDEVIKDEERIWQRPQNIPGIDLNEEEQFSLLQELLSYYKNIPFTAKPKKDLYYFFERGSYSYSDQFFFI
jgi:hypothetical protein